MELGSDGIVLLERTRVPYASLADIHRAYDEFLRVVDKALLERRMKGGTLGSRRAAPMAWLFDLRGAPTQRNDPEFEEVIKRRRPELFARSPHMVVLVKSAAGRMQLSRLSRAAEQGFAVSDNLDEARRWLLQRMSEEPPPR